MKHCIIAKYTPQAYERRAELLPRIREIFAVAGEIPGVRGAGEPVRRDDRAGDGQRRVAAV